MVNGIKRLMIKYTICRLPLRMNSTKNGISELFLLCNRVVRLRIRTDITSTKEFTFRVILCVTKTDFRLIIIWIFPPLIRQNQKRQKVGNRNGFLVFIICITEKMRLPSVLDKMKIREGTKLRD